MAVSIYNAFGRTCEIMFPGSVSERRLEPPWFDEVYRVKLSNGVVFSGDDMQQVLREADVYWRSVLRITGEIPWP